MEAARAIPWWRGALLLALATLVAATASAAPLTLGGDDRVLVLAPHPDDETLGCGEVIHEALARGAAVRVVFLTYGDANELSFALYRRRPVIAPHAVLEMGERRHGEAVAAGRALGLEPGQLVFLGYPDFGTLAIWKAHWRDRAPLKSLLTRVTAVPYASAFRPGAPYKGESILRDLSAILRDFRPTVVFVSHPADHNVDHRALYLFTRVALWDLPGEAQPALRPFLVHHPGWPSRKGLHETDTLDPPAAMAASIDWQRVPFPADARAAKLTALGAYQSQMRYSGDFLRSFVRTNELFGDFPRVALRPGAGDGLRSSAEGSARPDQLTDEERARFVGVEWRSVRLADGALVVTLRLSRPLGEAVGASLYLFGWRADRPFARMPKLRVELGAFAHGVFDQDRALRRETVGVEREAREIRVRVPLDALGRPERVLTSGGTSFLEVPLGSLAWRVVELPAPRARRAGRRGSSR